MILRTACHRPCTNSALDVSEGSTEATPPVAHIKALNALSNFPDHKIWIRILRYVYSKLTAKSHNLVALGRHV
jgi:hypothetical protein